MYVPLLDLAAQYGPIRGEVIEAISRVIDSQAFILGAPVAELESELCEYFGGGHAIGVSSGTDAILVALMANGIGQGDEVITTPYTFFATVGCITRLGAIPRFVDVCPDTFNMDVSALRGALSSRTRAIIPVHLFGQMADMAALLAEIQGHDLLVIEDAAQAIGARLLGRSAGMYGDCGCFSFFPSKNLGACGDGGLVVTQSEQMADRIRLLRSHGARPKYYHSLVGGNFRLDALQAAVVSVKLRYLDEWSRKRVFNARRYDELFASAGLGGLVRLPVGSRASSDATSHVFNQYVICVDRRDDLRKHLHGVGIGAEVYYPLPMHLQECYRGLGYGIGDFPIAERLAKESLALPIYPELSDEQASYVVQEIGRFVNGETRPGGAHQ